MLHWDGCEEAMSTCSPDTTSSCRCKSSAPSLLRVAGIPAFLCLQPEICDRQTWHLSQIHHSRLCSVLVYQSKYGFCILNTSYMLCDKYAEQLNSLNVKISPRAPPPLPAWKPWLPGGKRSPCQEFYLSVPIISSQPDVCLLWECGPTGQVILINQLNKSLKEMAWMDALHPDVVSRHLSCSVDHGICNDSSLAKGSTKGEPGEDVPGGRQHGWMRRFVGGWLG